MGDISNRRGGEHRQRLGFDLQDLAAVDLHGCEDSRDGHAGAHGRGQVSAVEHDLLARLDVRGDGAEGDSQAIEVVDAERDTGIC